MFLFWFVVVVAAHIESVVSMCVLSGGGGRGEGLHARGLVEKGRDLTSNGGGYSTIDVMMSG